MTASPYDEFEDSLDDPSNLLFAELGMSARTMNALSNNNINTFPELMSLSEDDLLDLRGLGRVGYEEIKQKIEALDDEVIQKLVDASEYTTIADLDKIHIESDFLDLPIANAIFSTRTYNALKKNGISVLGDLVEYTFNDLRTTFEGVGEKGIYEIKRRLSQPLSFNYKEFHEFLLTNINEHHLEVFDSYYGLSSNSNKKTLEDVAQENGVTRERIRQINKRVLDKIRTALITKVIKPSIEASILENINSPINDLPELSIVYHKEAVLRVYVDSQAFDMSLYKNIWLKSTWIVDDDFNIDYQVSRTLEALKSQIGPVKIKDLVSSCSLNEKILYDIKKTTITDGLIVLNTNKRAIGNDLAFEIRQYMEKKIRPVSISEVCDRLGATEVQVRGLMYRLPDVVNVGLSTYALEKYGYTSKPIIEIARDLLIEEGQPTHIDKIISYVTRYRLVKESSVPAQLSFSPDIFTRLDDGYIALTEWGYEPSVSNKGVRLEIPAVEAVHDILANNQGPMSSSDILDAVVKKYGYRSTNKLVTIYDALDKLCKKNIITKLGTQRSPYYVSKTE